MALKNFIQKEQSISAPAEVKSELEAVVMAKIDQTNRPIFKLASVLVVGVLLTVVTLQFSSNNQNPIEYMTVESIIQMDDHTAYWLEPLTR